MLAGSKTDDSGKFNDESRAPACGVFNPCAAVVQPDELANYRQADSTSTGRGLGRSRKSNVRVPYFLALTLWNARTLVFDCDDDFVFSRRERNFHCLAEGSVLHCVVEEIEHNLPQAAGIDAGNETGLDARVDLCATNASKRCKCIDRGLHLAIHLERLSDDSAPAVLGASECKNVLDEISETLRFLIDDSERSLSLRIGTELTVSQQLGEQADLRKRRTQLVRYTGHEIDSQLRELLLSPKLVDGRRDKPGSKRKQSDENRKSRSWETADNELRRKVGTK
jgi:hypothetical protein